MIPNILKAAEKEDIIDLMETLSKNGNEFSLMTKRLGSVNWAKIRNERSNDERRSTKQNALNTLSYMGL